VGIVLFAFSLRSAVASLSPLYDHIAADFDVPAAVIGLIGTAPPVCYAVFGLLTPALERRFGLERLAVVAMVVVAIGLIVRSLAPGSGLLLAGTALIFAAVGVGNILLPPLVKRYFADRVGLMTTVFSTTMALATFLPPLVAVPVADASDWHVSLGLWAVFALVAAVPWIGLAVRHAAAEKSRAEAAAADDDDIEQPSPRAFGRMWRLPIAWALLVGFAVSSSLAYTAFAWLPTILVDIAGVTPVVAGVLLALFGFMGHPDGRHTRAVRCRRRHRLRGYRGAALRSHRGAVAVGRAPRARTAALPDDPRASRPPHPHARGCGGAERVRAERRLRDRRALPRRHRTPPRCDGLLDRPAHRARRRGRGRHPRGRRRRAAAHRRGRLGTSPRRLVRHPTFSGSSRYILLGSPT
jgi:cyanate permease